jgi:hypothetical protein
MRPDIVLNLGVDGAIGFPHAPFITRRVDFADALVRGITNFDEG